MTGSLPTTVLPPQKKLYRGTSFWLDGLKEFRGEQADSKKPGVADVRVGDGTMGSERCG